MSRTPITVRVRAAPGPTRDLDLEGVAQIPIQRDLSGRCHATVRGGAAPVFQLEKARSTPVPNYEN
jgi:hypothetical protein